MENRIKTERVVKYFTSFMEDHDVSSGAILEGSGLDCFFGVSSSGGSLEFFLLDSSSIPIKKM